MKHVSSNLSIPFPEDTRAKVRTFDSFASSFDERWSGCPDQREYLSEIGELSLAKVLWGIFGRSVSTWLDSKLIVLEGHSPREFLTILEGRGILKSMIVESTVAQDAINPRRVAPIAKVRGGLDALCQVDILYRDDLWASKIAKTLSTADVYTDLKTIHRIGDQRYCFEVRSMQAVDAPGMQKFAMREVVQRALDHGYGLIVNPHKRLPDWILSFGDIVLFRETSLFYNPGFSRHLGLFSSASNDSFTLERAGRKILPAYSLPFIRSFMTRVLNIRSPAAAQAHLDRSQMPAIIFNLIREFYADEDAFVAHLSALSWFVRSDLPVFGCSLREGARSDLFPL